MRVILPDVPIFPAPAALSNVANITYPNCILGTFAYAPTNFRIACLFFIHESWLFCVCHITPDYPLFITYPCIVSGLHLAHMCHGYATK